MAGRFLCRGCNARHAFILASVCVVVTATLGLRSAAVAQAISSDALSIEDLSAIFDSLETASASTHYSFLEKSLTLMNSDARKGHANSQVERWYFGDGWYVSWVLHADTWPHSGVDEVPASLARAHFYNPEYASGVTYKLSEGSQGDASLSLLALQGVGSRYDEVVQSRQNFRPSQRLLRSGALWLPEVVRLARLKSVEPVEVDGVSAYRWTIEAPSIDKDGQQIGTARMTYTLTISADRPHRLYERTKFSESGGPHEGVAFSDWQVDGDLAFPRRVEHFFIHNGSREKFAEIKFNVEQPEDGAALDERHTRLTFYGLPEPDAPPSNWVRIGMVAIGGILLVVTGVYLRRRQA